MILGLNGIERKRLTNAKHTYERYRHAFEPDWFEQHRAEIVGNLEQIHSMLDECATNEKQINLTL